MNPEIIGKAIQLIRPESEVSIVNDEITWHTITGEKPTDAELNSAISQILSSEALSKLRLLRDRLLQQTDWRFRIDQEPSQAWYEYCQALRDLPANSEPQLDEFGNLTNVNWPTPPEN